MATTTATVRMPAATKRRLASAARRRGLTLSRYLIEAAERAAEKEPASLPPSPVLREVIKFADLQNTHPA